MIMPEMKKVIKYAIELDIAHIETFTGYMGDKVLKISTPSMTSVELIRKFLENMELTYKFDPEYKTSVKQDHMYLIFVGVEDPSMLRLKRV